MIFNYVISNSGGDYMDYYSSIKELLINNELTKKAKDYSKNRSDLITYYDVGKLLTEAGKKYGKNVINEYSEKLVVEIGKKYNPRTLRRMRQFYVFCKEHKWPPLAAKLTISHYDEIMKLKDVNEINYYIDICQKHNLSRNDLRLKIKNNEYWRINEESRRRLAKNEKLELIDKVKAPIFIRNTSGMDNISEQMLQKLILEDIPYFLNELGDGYCFIKNEYKIKLGDTYNYIDLLLFNIKYNCYVVVELKVTELKKEHIGQIEFYMNYIDNNLKTTNHNKTIGILIVKENNQFVIKYKTNEDIISRVYELI